MPHRHTDVWIICPRLLCSGDSDRPAIKLTTSHLDGWPDTLPIAPPRTTRSHRSSMIVQRSCKLHFTTANLRINCRAWTAASCVLSPSCLTVCVVCIRETGESLVPEPTDEVQAPVQRSRVTRGLFTTTLGRRRRRRRWRLCRRASTCARNIHSDVAVRQPSSWQHHRLLLTHARWRANAGRSVITRRSTEFIGQRRNTVALFGENTETEWARARCQRRWSTYSRPLSQWLWHAATDVSAGLSRHCERGQHNAVRHSEQPGATWDHDVHRWRQCWASSEHDRLTDGRDAEATTRSRRRRCSQVDESH